MPSPMGVALAICEETRVTRKTASIEARYPVEKVQEAVIGQRIIRCIQWFHHSGICSLYLYFCLLPAIERPKSFASVVVS